MRDANLRSAKLFGAAWEEVFYNEVFGATMNLKTLEASLPFVATPQSVTWSHDGEWLAIAEASVIRSERVFEQSVSLSQSEADVLTCGASLLPRIVNVWACGPDGRP